MEIFDFAIKQAIHKRIVRFQKLTRNVFLTLHGHNVHRQQRQLSMFLMRYQQFASHAYCGAAGPVSKMASQQEKAFCVLRFEVSTSVITQQREFRTRFRKDAPCVFSKPCTKLRSIKVSQTYPLLLQKPDTFFYQSSRRSRDISFENICSILMSHWFHNFGTRVVPSHT